jgi:hypothetical protein
VLEDAFPKTLDALLDGQITWQHATVIVDELGSLEKRSRGILEAQALAEAVQVTPNRLDRIVRLARERLNPKTIQERQEAARHLRGVSVVDGRDGMSTLFYTAPSMQVHAIFSRLTAAARAIDGPAESRTLDQRRADVFGHVMLAEVGGEVFGLVPDEHGDENFVKWYRGIKAEVVVSVPVMTLLGHSDEPATLDGWVPIDPDTARILVGSATSFIRVLTHRRIQAVIATGASRSLRSVSRRLVVSVVGR